LKIETENLENHQVKLTVDVDSDQLEIAKRKAAKKLAKRIKVPGFRPGKAPYGVIQRQVGDGALFEEGLEILINDIYPDVIKEAEIEPYGPGNLENIISAVENDFGQRQAVEETAERPAETGDHVYVQLSAKRFEEEAESEPGNLIEERSTSMIIADEEEDTSSEWPFDGFSRELVGMSVGEDKTLIYTFPEDSQFETLRDVTAEFSIEIEDIKARILPDLNDEFAQSLGEYEDLEALEKDIRESLEQRAEETYNAEYDDQILEAILDESTIRYPPQMLDSEINNVIHQLESRLANQGLDMDIYLKTRDLDEQGLREETTPVAEARINRSLILLEIAQKEEIEVSEKELQQETERTLDSITRFMSESDRKQFDSPNAMINLAGNIYAEMRMNRTLEYLRSVAKGEELTDSAEEVEQDELSAEAAGEIEVIEEEVSSEAELPVEESQVEDTTEVEPEQRDEKSEQDSSNTDEG
jgi:trigger factor